MATATAQPAKHKGNPTFNSDTSFWISRNVQRRKCSYRNRDHSTGASVNDIVRCSQAVLRFKHGKPAGVNVQLFNTSTEQKPRKGLTLKAKLCFEGTLASGAMAFDLDYNEDLGAINNPKRLTNAYECPDTSNLFLVLRLMEQPAD